MSQSSSSAGSSPHAVPENISEEIILREISDEVLIQQIKFRLLQKGQNVAKIDGAIDQLRQLFESNARQNITNADIELENPIKK